MPCYPMAAPWPTRSPSWQAAFASIVGASHVVTDDRLAERATAGAAKAGVLVDVRVAPLDALPFEADSFDLVVVHSAGGMLASLEETLRVAALRECRRVLRTGGRLVAVEAGTPSGLTSFLHKAPAGQQVYDASGGTTAALRRAEFSPVRELGDREGLRFAEGLKG